MPALTLTTDGQNAALDGFFDNLNSGTLEIQTSGAVELATVTFGATAFAAASGGSKTANAITDDTNATGGGTAAICSFKKSDATELATGTVSTSGANVNLSTTTISSGDTVSISSATASMA